MTQTLKITGANYLLYAHMPAKTSSHASLSKAASRPISFYPEHTQPLEPESKHKTEHAERHLPDYPGSKSRRLLVTLVVLY